MDKSIRSFSLDKYSEDQCNQPLKQAVISVIYTRQSALPLEIAISILVILISKSKPLLDICHSFCISREEVKSPFVPRQDRNKSKYAEQGGTKV